MKRHLFIEDIPIVFLEQLKPVSFRGWFEHDDKEFGKEWIYVSTVGTVSLRHVSRITMQLDNLYVHPAYRGRHCGMDLVHAAVKKAKLLGYRRVRIVPDKGTVLIKFWTNLGFDPTGDHIDVEKYLP